MVTLLAVKVSNFSTNAAKVLEQELQLRYKASFSISPHIYPSEMLPQLYLENCHNNLIQGRFKFPAPPYEPIEGFMVMAYCGPTMIAIHIDQWSKSGIHCYGRSLAPVEFINRAPNTAPTAILYRVPPQPIDHLTPTEDELLPEQKN